MLIDNKTRRWSKLYGLKNSRGGNEGAENNIRDLHSSNLCLTLTMTACTPSLTGGNVAHRFGQKKKGCMHVTSWTTNTKNGTVQVHFDIFVRRALPSVAKNLIISWRFVRLVNHRGHVTRLWLEPCCSAGRSVPL